MSAPAEVTDTPAFGNSFEAALEAAFAEAGTPIEPANPTPQEVVPEPEVPKEKAKVAETIEEVEDVETPDILLPIDEEPPEVEEEPDTTGMTKAAGERFKTLRAEIKAAKTALATREQEAAQAIARVKELEALTGESETLQKKIADYELELSVSRLEATEQFKTSVTQPLAEIAHTAADIAKKYDIDANKLFDAIAIENTEEQDEAFDDILTGVNDRDKLKIFALAEKLPAIMEQRAKLQENSAAALAELDARKAAEQATLALEASKARKAASELVATRVTSALPFLKESDKFALDIVKSKTAESDFAALDPTTQAYSVYAGHLIPQLAKAYSSVMKEVETLTDELAKYKKASPSVKGGAAAPADVADSKLSFAEAVDKAFGSM